MNKPLKEKLLFITGGIIAVFGLVFFQQKFPVSLEGSRFLAQVPGENTYEECISDPTSIIQNGDFEQFLDGAFGPVYSLSNVNQFINKEVCFFEGVTAVVLFDYIIESNVARTLYMKHVFDGNPDSIFFGGDQSSGLVQHIPNMNPGDYQISFKAKKDTFMQDFSSDGSVTVFIGFSDTVLESVNFNFPSCVFASSDIVTTTNLTTQAGLYDDCILSQFDHYTQVVVDSEDYFNQYVANISITNPNIQYMYIFPYGITPEWDPIPWVNLKPYSYVFFDDIAIDNFTCGISFQGKEQVLYSNLEGKYVSYESGNINIEDIGNQYFQSTMENGNFYIYSPTPGSLLINTLNTNYTEEDILNLFSIEGGEITSIVSYSGGSFWIEYECLESCQNVPEDLNQDGVVDGVDVEFFLNFFGQSCSNLESCQFDFDNDGIITVQDLMILTASVGQQCGVPLSSSVPDIESDEDSQNNPYQSQGNFVKPSKIPGLEKPYNYIVYTKILDMKLSSLQIQNFFPKNMILRGLYSSTKNISLISKEGVVRLFDLGKTASIKSYLYLEVSPEICKTVSQNEKAYAELVSYGLCK